MAFLLKFKTFPPPCGPLSYANVPWDSELFGLPFYDLRLSAGCPEAVGESLPAWLSGLPGDRPHLVFTRVPASDVGIGRILTRHGFYPVETMMELSLPLARMRPVTRRLPAQLTLRPAQANDLPRLMQIAAAAFSTDRFHLDPNLPAVAADRRYAGWVEHGYLSGDRVLMFEDTRGGAIIGFVQFREVGIQVVDLSLAAVDPACQKSGLGSLMYQAALADCHQQGFQIATARLSASNLDELNLFARLGFIFLNVTLTYHRYHCAGAGMT